ncbi:hypothetical protein THRCLA_08698 [Thraustotheca clavata]|uniref:RING-type domain-containing protein n=1 Tax=Thraustotheca clavata TaxID=74557 RepID=A0A1V9Z368_9STRA|nr:hypothetical protein THRCLA_08698 [Thraustotheca clavata]
MPSLLHDIDVSASVAAKGGEVFTQFNVTITCPFTREFWAFHKRYSDFYRFRESLKLILNAATTPTSLSVRLNELIQTPFPSKHLRPLRNKVMLERALLFQYFLVKTIEFRDSCSKLITETPTAAFTAKRYVSLISDFLGIHDVPQIGYEQTTPAIMEETCAICLDEFNAEDLVDGTHVVSLPCNHVYHQTCVGQWLRAKKSCPLCRDPVRQITGLYL